MTTSFPPINYPNKPVPPFSAPAPRNPFPGFYPDMWRNITGKPYITVSSKGLANGQSEYFNDGADFGPDSLQADGSLTQTYGWQESFNYIASKGGGSIYFKAGIYDFTNAPVQTGNNGKNGKVIFPVIAQSDFYGMQGVKFIFETPYWYNNVQTVEFTPDNVGYGVIIYDNQTVPPSDSDSYAEILFDSPTNETGAHRSMIQLETEGAIGIYIPLGYVTCIDFGDICGLEGDTFVVATLSPKGNNITSYNSAGTGVGLSLPSEGVYYPVHIKAINATYFSYAGVYMLSGGVTIDFLQTQANSRGVLIANQIAPVYIHYWITLADDYALNIASSGSGKVAIDLILFSNSQYALTPTYTFYYQNGSPTYVDIKTWDVYNDSTFFPTFSGFPAGSIKIPAKALQGQSFTPTISANPPVSGTVYQNTNPYDIEIDLPVYATTSGTAGYVTIAKGASSTPTAIGNQFVSGSTSSTSTDIIKLRVPAGWYYSFTGSGVTFATATPFAE